MPVDQRPAFSIAELPPYLTEDEVAAYLKVSLKTLVRLRYDKKGPPFRRLGKEYRYSMSGLLNWLNCKTA
jgi:excisionase family DNA binding protein